MEQEQTKSKRLNIPKIALLAGMLSLGLSFVYAWTAPVSLPPADNIAPLLNTSSSTQVKLGQLEVGSLTVNSDLKSGTTTVICNTSSGGMIRFNNSINKIEYCNTTEWKPIAEQVDPPAVAMFTASDPIARTNIPFTLSWSTNDAVACNAGGSWVAAKDPSGNQSITETTTGNRAYTLTCSNEAGFASSSVPVEVRLPIGTVNTYTGAVVNSGGTASDGVNVWKVNLQSNSVTKISPTGAMTTYTGTGTRPLAIAYNHVTKDMWVVNCNNSASIDCPGNGVTKISPTGAMTIYPRAGVGSFHGEIAFDGENMWTTNGLSNSVTKISPAGVMTTYSGTGSYPSGIAFDGTNMWTSNVNGDSVTKISPTGAMTTYAGLLDPTGGIAFDGINMWALSNGGGGITKISPTGIMTTYFGVAPVASRLAFDGTNMWTVGCAEYVQEFGDCSGIMFSRVSPSGTVTAYPGALGADTSYYITFDGMNMWAFGYPSGTAIKIQAI